MAIEIQGTPVDADNLPGLLQLCADNMPGDYKPDAHTWGFGAASKFLDDAAGTPLYDQALQILGDFLASGSSEAVDLAQGMLPPGRASVDQLRSAAARTDLDQELRRKLNSALSRALAWQPDKYDPSMRAHAGKPDWETLIGAMLVADHPWLMSHLTDVLGSDPDQAANQLWYGIQSLNEAEAHALRDEFAAASGELGAAYAQSLVDCVDGELKSGTFAGRGGGVRWPRMALVP